MAFKKKLNQRTGEWIVGSWFATPHTLNFDNFVESFGIACPKIIYISNVYSFWHIKNIRHSSLIYFQAKSSKKSSWAENTCESLNWWVSYWKIKSQHRKLAKIRTTGSFMNIVPSSHRTVCIIYILKPLTTNLPEDL